jgi:hypothetical protein
MLNLLQYLGTYTHLQVRMLVRQTTTSNGGILLDSSKSDTGTNYTSDIYVIWYMVKCLLSAGTGGANGCN